MLRRLYRQIQAALDLGVLALAFLLAFLLRFEFSLAGYGAQIAVQMPFAVLVQFAALSILGTRRRAWRYTNLHDVPAFASAIGSATAIILLVRFAPLAGLAPLRIPLSIIVGDATFAFAGIVGVRLVRRAIDERIHRSQTDNGSATGHVPTILIGAGRAGVLAIRELEDRGDSGIKVLAFVDDDPLKAGAVIAGIRVLGTSEQLPALVAELGAEQVVLTIAEITPERRRRLVDICAGIPVRLREIPGYFEILQGDVAISRIRDVDPEDLLGREPVRMDEKQLGVFLGGRRVLITGAGGSIGSELCRQAARFGVRRLGMIERAEHALFGIDRELRGTYPHVPCDPLLADVGDARRIDDIVRDFRPDIVVHAAAHKHVPMMEQHPVEALSNNILGTQVVADAAGRHGASHFILVSTDKAVRPTSVMGASKRVAELVVQDLDRRYATRYSAVRFGNVLGSAGSVIPIFSEQIAAGGPVTVTDPEMTRYFMSIPEAAQLVLRAGSLAEGGEIFVLDMGKPVRILDLAERMIRLSGFEPYEDIRIVITGKRRGEKLFEELGRDAEKLSLTRHPKIFIGKLTPHPPEALEAGLQRIRELVAAGDGQAARAFLSELLPDARLDLQAAIALGQGA